MSQEKHLPIAHHLGVSTISTTSSLLDRGLAALQRSSENDEAEKLYQEALALCAGIDFVAISEINSSISKEVDWIRHPAVDIFKKAANLGHRDSKFCLGAMCICGSQLDALNWYRKAAEQGHPEAAYQYVKYLLLDSPEQRSPFAPPISLEKACELLEIAAREKHTAASRELGYLFLKQSEESTNQERQSLLARASIWLRQAAETGDADAAFQYAELLYMGDGVMVDYAAAARWYAIAVDQGHRKAMVEFAYLYERGQGVPLDKMAAASLYQRAGKLAFEEGNMEEAIEHFKYANELDGDEDSCFIKDVISMCKQEARLAIEIEDFEKAFKYFKFVGELADFNYHDEMLTVCEQHGRLALKNEDFEKASRYFKYAEGLCGDENRNFNNEATSICRRQGRLAIENMDFKKALRYFRYADELGGDESFDYIDEIISICNQQGRLALESENHGKALEYFK